MSYSAGRTPLPDTIKKRLKSLIVELRRMLEDDLGRQLKRLGFDAAKSAATPIEKLTYLTVEEIAARRVLDVIAAKEQAVAGSYAAGIEALRREAAYTHLNRLVGLKCLELRGHLIIDGEPTEVVTVRLEYGDRSKGLWVLREREARYRFGEDAEEILWRAGITQACAAITVEIGVLFDPADPYAQVWPSHRALRAAIDRLNELPDETFRADELLGWVYQYFQSDEKNRVFEAVRTQKTKIAGADIVPVTQLYTEQYMVDFLLQNSLGARWMEMYPDSNARAQWPYYVTPATPHTRPPKPLKAWKLIDPCVGSGHFEVAAFDLFTQLYAEERALAEAGRIPREWAVPVEDVAATILAHNLHGIDIDPRAVQLATLALYLKAKEYLPHPLTQSAHPERNAVESKDARSSTLPLWSTLQSAPTPRARFKINLVAADTSFLQGEAWTRFLNGFEQEPSVRRVLEALARSLENIRELGSLLRPEVELRNIIAEEHHRWEAQVRRGVEQMVLFPEFEGTQQEALPFEEITDDEFWNRLSYRAEAAIRAFLDEARASGEIDERVVAGEAQRGFAFLELCQQRYDVVCTNPPYMGSNSMGNVLKRFLAKHYAPGKRDLYSAFIIRCCELAGEDGHVSMVTQQSWMFLSSFADLRASPLKNTKAGKLVKSTGILRETSILTLAHLGPAAFSEISGQVVNIALFVLGTRPSTTEHRFTAFRVVAGQRPEDKVRLIVDSIEAKGSAVVSYPLQSGLLELPESPILYWLDRGFIDLLRSSLRLTDMVDLRQGMATADNQRFLRFWWEVNGPTAEWKLYAKGGGYCKWVGFEELTFDYRDKGQRFRDFEAERFADSEWNGILGRKLALVERYANMPGVVYTQMAQGSLSPRLWDGGFFDVKSIAVFPLEQEEGLSRLEAAGLLSTHYTSFLLRALTQNLEFHAGYTALLPVPKPDIWRSQVSNLADFATRLKRVLTRSKLTERIFLDSANRSARFDEQICCGLHAAEGAINKVVTEAAQLETKGLQQITDETGTPAGWYSLIGGYESLPEILTEFSSLPQELIDYLAAQPRLTPAPEELARIKDRLRAWYIAGPGSKEEEGESSDSESDEGEENNVVLGARIPIPAETFLEELAQKMELHPITVYWLLEELRREEGIVCPPELKRQTEDYFSVKLLRMLGHRWPMQDHYEQEQGHPFIDPQWIDLDGIIPLTSDSGDEVLIDRLHRFLDAEFGPERGPSVEVEAAQIFGWKPGDEWGAQKPLPLARWFERDFFKRHGSQFKKRPIAWHLSSTKGTFQAIVSYHKFDRDRLTLLRARYVRDRLDSLRKQLGQLQADASELDRRTLNAIADLEAKIADVQDFDDRLRRLLEGREREARIWCPWKPADEQPIGWQPDINDGVRVNLAPVQRLGLLAADVLAAKDVRSLLAPEGRE